MVTHLSVSLLATEGTEGVVCASGRCASTGAGCACALPLVPHVIIAAVLQAISSTIVHLHCDSSI